MNEKFNNAFTVKMAKILGYGTKDYSKNVKNLKDEVEKLFPGQKIGASTIRSWFTQGKYPRRKNVMMIAKIYNLTPDELIAPSDCQPIKPVINEEMINRFDNAIKTIIPVFKDKYIDLDSLPQIKQEIIKNVIAINNGDGLDITKRASELGLAKNKPIGNEDQSSSDF